MTAHLIHTLHAIHATIAPHTINALTNTPTEKKKNKKDETPNPEPTETTQPDTNNDTPTNTPTSNPNDSGNTSDPGTPNTTDDGPLQWALNNPIPVLVLIALIAAMIGANIGWKKLTLRQNLAGQPLAPLSMIISRTIKLITKEDNQPVFYRPENFARKMLWFTWKKYWLLTLILAITNLPPLTRYIPNSLSLWTLLATGFLTLAGIQHIRTVIRRRHRILMQMFEVAMAEMRYPKGAELNPWGYVQITKWNNLYSPDTTYVMFPARYRSEDPRNREAFETNFNGTVSNEHTWTYEWESSNNRVIATPVPFITSQAPYPFPDLHEWNEFPLGIAAGGKEAIVNVQTFPHMLVAGTTGSGKLTSTKELVPTPSGWTTMGDIKVGDQVFDEQGNPCTVTWVSEINEQPDLYEVEFSDGTVIEADAEHLWYTETRQVRESRWNAARKTVERRSLVKPENLAKIAELGASVSSDDEITVRQFAELADVHPTSPWLLEIADRLGPVGEIQNVTTFHYAEQVVRQKQKVTLYNARAAWGAIAEFVPRRKPVYWQDGIPIAAEMLATVGPDDLVTASQMQVTLGVKSVGEVNSILQRLGVEGRVEKQEVELVVPAKTVTRKGKWARTYSTKLMCEAVLERCERPAHDQRHKNTHGSVKTTAEIMATLKRGEFHNHAIPVAKPLQLPEADLPIDPYVLGVWLGDGYSATGNFIGIDHEIARHVEACGYETVESLPSNMENRHPDTRIWKIVGLTDQLRLLNVLHDKHVPAVYLRASIAQRSALLAGLLDTDGTVAPQGTVHFDNTNIRIAHQALELARSLGYRATIISGIKKSQNGTECEAFRIAWTCEESPFRLSRKTEAHRERNQNFTDERNDTRFIVDIRKAITHPGRCISVDSPSRLFLVGEAMVPTHNSVTQRTLLLHALQTGWRVLLVDPKRVELSAYRAHPHTVKIATELDESVQLIEQVEQEMQSRYLQMQKEGVNHFKRMADPPAPLLLMVDELFALLSPENIKSDEGKERDELHARAQTLIGSIARLGRASGIHMILATQRPDAKILGGEVKALALDTPVLTLAGWSTMGDLSVGDRVFDDAGRPTEVVAATEVLESRECFRVEFSDGSHLIADADHLWSVEEPWLRDLMGLPDVGAEVGVRRPVSTKELAVSDLVDGVGRPVFGVRVGWSAGAPLFGFARDEAVGALRDSVRQGTSRFRFVTGVTRVESVPVRCIRVAAASGLFLAGRGLVATHNSNLDVRIAQGRMDTTPSLMVMDSDHATRIPPVKGRAMVRLGGEVTEFQAYFLPEDALPQVLEMSGAIATGRISAQELKALAEGAGAGDVGGGSRFRLPRVPLPSGLVSWFGGWKARREEAVSRNEEERRAFTREQKGLKPYRKGKGAGSGDVDPFARHAGEPSVDEVARDARRRGVRPGSGFAEEELRGSGAGGGRGFDEDGFEDEFGDGPVGGSGFGFDEDEFGEGPVSGPVRGGGRPPVVVERVTVDEAPESEVFREPEPEFVEGLEPEVGGEPESGSGEGPVSEGRVVRRRVLPRAGEFPPPGGSGAGPRRVERVLPGDVMPVSEPVEPVFDGEGGELEERLDDAVMPGSVPRRRAAQRPAGPPEPVSEPVSEPAPVSVPVPDPVPAPEPVAGVPGVPVGVPSGSPVEPSGGFVPGVGSDGFGRVSDGSEAVSGVPVGGVPGRGVPVPPEVVARGVGAVPPPPFTPETSASTGVDSGEEDIFAVTEAPWMPDVPPPSRSAGPSPFGAGITTPEQVVGPPPPPPARAYPPPPPSAAGPGWDADPAMNPLIPRPRPPMSPPAASATDDVVDGNE